jgi:hypothetical protein
MLKQAVQYLGEHYAAAIAIMSDDGDSFEFECSGGEVLGTGILLRILAGTATPTTHLIKITGDLGELAHLVVAVATEDGHVLVQTMGNPLAAAALARLVLSVQEASVTEHPQ